MIIVYSPQILLDYNKIFFMLFDVYKPSFKMHRTKHILYYIYIDNR